MVRNMKWQRGTGGGWSPTKAQVMILAAAFPTFGERWSGEAAGAQTHTSSMSSWRENSNNRR